MWRRDADGAFSDVSTTDLAALRMAGADGGLPMYRMHHLFDSLSIRPYVAFPLACASPRVLNTTPSHSVFLRHRR